MPDQSLTQLTSLGSLSADDILYIVDDPTGTPLSRKVTISIFDSRFDGRYVNITGDTVTGAMVFQNSVTIEGANGIDIGAAGVDSDLITADGGAAVLKWDDIEDAFSFSNGIRVLAGDVGIGTSDPKERLHVDGNILLSNTRGMKVYDASGLEAFILQMNAADDITCGDSTGRTDNLRYFSAGSEVMRVTTSDEVLIGSFGGGAKLYVDQSSATGAKPVLLLDQADVSEEMIELTSTVGVGNAIEAVGAKTLTTTHFIKITITGVGTRYIPIGTIA